MVLVAGLLSLSGSSAQASAFNVDHLNKIQKRLVSGGLFNALGSPSAKANLVPGGGDPDAGPGPDGSPELPPSNFATAAGASTGAANFKPAGNGACSERLGNNVKVNQNCLNVSDGDLQGRGQANNETFIAADPNRPDHLVASDNDYVRGDGTCGAAYSLDNGRSWNNSTVPNVFTRGATFGGFARQYWQAGGDTSVAWDSRGNAYFSCQLFNRGNAASSNPDQSSMFAVFRSTGNNGASWNFPGRAVAEAFEPDGASLLDKQLIAVDSSKTSPFRDRVYVTYTLFAADGTAYIYESHSSDYGEHFSPRVLVSGNSGLCTVTFGVPTPNGTCNENQFSAPFTGPDGALYVAFANFNNATSSPKDNHNQMLLAKSTDGGQTFGPPVKVSDYYDLPECDGFQGDGADPGRSCVPEKGASTRSVFRAANYPSVAVNPRDAKSVVVTFGSYISAHSNETNGCVPDGIAPDSGLDLYVGVKDPGACNNDIVVSTSHDAGATFTGTNADVRTLVTATPSRGQATTDQWFHWSAFGSDGTLAVDYYDRQYGNDEFNGNSDISLSGSRDLRHFSVRRVTSSSMPPPTQFGGPNGGTFFGDYIGLAVAKQAHPIWSDTRAVDLFTCPGSATGPGNPPRLCTATEPNGQIANDQEMFTASVSVPH